MAVKPTSEKLELKQNFNEKESDLIKTNNNEQALAKALARAESPGAKGPGGGGTGR